MLRKTVLDNQLKIISHPMKGYDSVSLGIWVAAGGRYEDDRIKGAAHFLEHILFKGSKKYSCDEIKKSIEGVGGTLNAFTAEECTCYFAKIPSLFLSKTWDVLSDMVFDPMLAKKDVEKERSVILEEIKMYHDLPQHYVLELLDEIMWPDHPLGKNLAGSFESVGKMSTDDLRAFHRKYYSPDRIVVAAAGRLSHENLVRMVRQRAPRTDLATKEDFLKADNVQKKPRTKFFRKKIEQMHLALGMFGPDRNDPSRYAVSLMNIILGANMSSRLFNEVRERRGLAYAIGSSVKFLSDTGLFLIRAGVDNKKIVEALDVILKELRKIRRAKVDSGELRRAKDYYMGQIMLGLEDTLDQMFWIGESTLMLNRAETYRGMLKKINLVTAAQVQEAAARVLAQRRFNLSIVGPLQDRQEKQLSALLAGGD